MEGLAQPPPPPGSPQRGGGGAAGQLLLEEAAAGGGGGGGAGPAEAGGGRRSPSPRPAPEAPRPPSPPRAAEDAGPAEPGSPGAAEAEAAGSGSGSGSESGPAGAGPGSSGAPSPPGEESRSLESLESFSNLHSGCPSSSELNSDAEEAAAAAEAAPGGPAPEPGGERPAAGAQLLPASKERFPGQSVYHIKWVRWKEENTPVITQNENGPCPLLAIMNVLLLAWKVAGLRALGGAGWGLGAPTGHRRQPALSPCCSQHAQSWEMESRSCGRALCCRAAARGVLAHGGSRGCCLSGEVKA